MLVTSAGPNLALGVDNLEAKEHAAGGVLDHLHLYSELLTQSQWTMIIGLGVHKRHAPADRVQHALQRHPC